MSGFVLLCLAFNLLFAHVAASFQNSDLTGRCSRRDSVFAAPVHVDLKPCGVDGFTANQITSAIRKAQPFGFDAPMLRSIFFDVKHFSDSKDLHRSVPWMKSSSERHRYIRREFVTGVERES